MDALTAHLDKIADEGGQFTLTRSGKEWVASGTRKHGRKEISASGETAIAAVAGLLEAIRGETSDHSEEE